MFLFTCNFVISYFFFIDNISISAHKTNLIEKYVSILTNGNFNTDNLLSAILKYLDGVYEVLVNFLSKLYINSRGTNINLSSDVCVMILIQFKVLSQSFDFYLQVYNMVNFVLRSNTLLAIFLLVIFLDSLIISPHRLLFILFFLLFISLSIHLINLTDVGLILASRYSYILLAVLV